MSHIIYSNSLEVVCDYGGQSSFRLRRKFHTPGEMYAEADISGSRLASFRELSGSSIVSTLLEAQLLRIEA